MKFLLPITSWSISSGLLNPELGTLQDHADAIQRWPKTGQDGILALKATGSTGRHSLSRESGGVLADEDRPTISARQNVRQHSCEHQLLDRS